MTELETAILRLRGAMGRLDRSVGKAAARSVAQSDGVRAQANAIERLAAENARLRAARENERALRIDALGEVDAAIAALELAVGDSVADLIAQDVAEDGTRAAGETSGPDRVGGPDRAADAEAAAPQPVLTLVDAADVQPTVSVDEDDGAPAEASPQRPKQIAADAPVEEAVHV